jgi:hypothetical protein
MKPRIGINSKFKFKDTLYFYPEKLKVISHYGQSNKMLGLIIWLVWFESTRHHLKLFYTKKYYKHYQKTYGQYKVAVYMYFTIVTFFHIL